MDENMKKLTKEKMIANYYRLLGSVMSARFCLENSLPFRGHDESEESNSQDESSDVSLKEQMAVVVRFVDKLWAVRESFIRIIHVKDTASTTLKQAIDDLLASNQLSINTVRGQSYDGASNMRGEFNGLKALILKDNPSAHYIHCFAHQLQLVIVVVAKKHASVKTFYEFLSMVVTTVSASCKREDMLREEKRLEWKKRYLKFDPSKILAFAKMYPDDFTTQEIGSLLGDIESFRHTISDDDNFEDLNGISDLARVMVEMGTHSSCPTVYRIVKLALLLPVATATVERCFSKLKLVKTDLHNRIARNS
ncbi:zinc finger MYM-type protein 1-like [Helianthus annuus]|uniref:zinc finger MYM-type protein 1-like n=1 Tax=Helianthus annuus TaxID=4232 RepID=UPI000B8FF55A|nr:zinc finger MYM-type protein 1-like [Helianthus annuus]